MAVDTSGNWWVGEVPEDIRMFLEAYASAGYKIKEFTQSVCTCGSKEFRLFADDDEGCAKRECVACKRSHFICDSEEYWVDASPEEWHCIECGSKSANLGVGFSLYEDGEVHWLYVGTRCVSCGILGCFAGWKIAYTPSKQLLEQA